MSLSLLVMREVNRRDLWPKVVARRAGLLRLRDSALGVVEASVRAAFEFAHWRNSFYTDAPDWSEECEPAAALAWDGENKVDGWARVGREAQVRIVERVIATLSINVGDVTTQVREAGREHLQSGVREYLDSPDYLEQMMEVMEHMQRTDEARRRDEDG